MNEQLQSLPICQHIHCSLYPVVLIASPPIQFAAHKLTLSRLDVQFCSQLSSYWPSLWRWWNKFVTTWSTVHYTRYTRIIHCRPCCNVHVQQPTIDIALNIKLIGLCYVLHRNVVTTSKPHPTELQEIRTLYRRLHGAADASQALGKSRYALSDKAVRNYSYIANAASYTNVVRCSVIFVWFIF